MVLKCHSLKIAMDGEWKILFSVLSVQLCELYFINKTEIKFFSRYSYCTLIRNCVKLFQCDRLFLLFLENLQYVKFLKL